MLSIHLRLGLPSGLFPSGFPTNNLSEHYHKTLLQVGNSYTSIRTVGSGEFCEVRAGSCLIVPYCSCRKSLSVGSMRTECEAVVKQSLLVEAWEAV
jgi:hypothetical protein